MTQKQQQVNVTNEQVSRACAAVGKLLCDDERVNVPPSLAMSGELTIVVGILQSLATGAAVLTNPPVELPKGNDGAENVEKDEA